MIWECLGAGSDARFNLRFGVIWHCAGISATSGGMDSHFVVWICDCLCLCAVYFVLFPIVYHALECVWVGCFDEFVGLRFVLCLWFYFDCCLVLCLRCIAITLVCCCFWLT